MVDKDRHGMGEEKGRESQGGAGKKEGGERAGKAGEGVDEAQAQEEQQEGVKKKKKKKRKMSEGENGVEETGNEVVGGREAKGTMRIRKSEGGEELKKKGKKRKSV